MNEHLPPLTDYVLKARLKRFIADNAATWETEFDAGPGEVVSLDDAAHVAAKFIVAEEQR